MLQRVTKLLIAMSRCCRIMHLCLTNKDKEEKEEKKEEEKFVKNEKIKANKDKNEKK